VSDLVPVFGLATGILAVVLWAVLFVRTLIAFERGAERRASWVLMAFTALLASIGAFASAIGSAQTIGTIERVMPYEALVFMTNVGRGALATAAILLLTHAGRKDAHR
jgi:hypothetical protein